MPIAQKSALIFSIKGALYIFVLLIFILPVAVAGCTYAYDMYDIMIGRELAIRRERQPSFLLHYTGVLANADTAHVSYLIYDETVISASPFNVLGINYTCPIKSVKINIGPNSNSYNRITVNNSRVIDWGRHRSPTFMGPQRLEDIYISTYDYSDGLYEVLKCMTSPDLGLQETLKEFIKKEKYTGSNRILVWDFASQTKVDIRQMMRLLSVDESATVLQFSEAYDAYASKMGTLGFTAKYE